MAREGLRTLVVGKKTLTEDQYQDFEVGNYNSKTVMVTVMLVTVALIEKS